MTKLEALQMVRNAMLHTDEFSELAEQRADVDLRWAERGLEFELYFDLGGEVRRVA
jgi:hypothetical protein